MNKSPDFSQAITAGQLIEKTAEFLAAAELYFGHGTENAQDEAAALVFHVMHLDHYGEADQYEQAASAAEKHEIGNLSVQRVTTRQPLPYLLGEAWFAGMPFAVNSSVLIPRSPIAELINTHFEPWLKPGQVRSVLEIGTGSGCIAIACAMAFPSARVVATDISPEALEVAGQNVARYGLAERVELVLTDHTDGVAGPFDLIVSNPPYVPEDEIEALPKEYHHEPGLALYSGADGLDSARRILQDAAQLLSPDGILVLEVGAQWTALQDAYPELAFNWLEFEFGGIGVGLLSASALQT